MAEIIDVLSPRLADCFSFTVDTTGPDYVAVVDPGQVSLKNTYNVGSFKAGDNLLIMSAGFVMPEMFTLWKPVADANPLLQYILIPVGNTTGHQYRLTNISDGLFMPLENYEMGIGTFFDVETAVDIVDGTGSLLNEDFILKIQFNIAYPLPKVSMKNVPASYNGEVFSIVPFLKVLHNLRITAP
jgi:hypothetical protein